MRLVDADPLILEMENEADYEFDRARHQAFYQCATMVSRAKTLYDVDRVISQLQNYMGCNSKCREEFAHGQGCSVCSLSRIFEIVRKGGVE